MAKQKSRKGKGSYLSYKVESRYRKNKEKRIRKHLKNHPNDKQSEEALKNIPIEAKRGRPINRGSVVGSTEPILEVLEKRDSRKIPYDWLAELFPEHKHSKRKSKPRSTNRPKFARKNRKNVKSTKNVSESS